MTHADLLSRITARPDVFGGKPIMRDMRIAVELVLSLLTQGVTPEEILQDYPNRSRTTFGRACCVPTALWRVSTCMILFLYGNFVKVLLDVCAASCSLPPCCRRCQGDKRK